MIVWADRLNRLAAADTPCCEHERAATLAASDAADWPTCAVGEHRAALEARGERFTDGGAPRTAALYALGMGFCDSLAARDFRAAADFLSKIEQWDAGTTHMETEEI